MVFEKLKVFKWYDVNTMKYGKLVELNYLLPMAMNKLGAIWSSKYPTGV